MKISIAVTLIITIAVFSFISGYSISAHNKRNSSHNMASTANASNAVTATANATEYSSAASGGYGSPDSEKAVGNASPSGYGAPSPGYGQ